MLYLSILKSILISLESTSCFPWSSIAFLCFLAWLSIVLVCFSKAFPKGEYVKLSCPIAIPWSKGSSSSPARYIFIYMEILPDNNADIFAPSFLISYCTFPSSILWSVVLISFYILSKRFFLECKRLADAITKKNTV